MKPLDLDPVFKALADPFRRQLLLALSDRRNFCQTPTDTPQGICVQDLSKLLHSPQSTVSRHLAILAHAGLVNHARWRTWHYYAIQPRILSQTMEWLGDLISPE